MCTSSHRSCKRRSSCARVLLSLVLMVLVAPLLSVPASAGVSQGNTYWYITDEEYIDGELCYVISLFQDGSRYPTLCDFAFCVDTSHPSDQLKPVGWNNETGTIWHCTVVPFTTLEVPRNGFYVDDDWLVSLQVHSLGLTDYEDDFTGITFTLYDPTVFPTLYLEVPTGYASSTPQLSRVYPFYYSEDFSTGFTVEDGDSPMSVSSLVYGINSVVYDIESSSNVSISSESAFMLRSLEGSNVSNLVPIVFVDPTTVEIGRWYHFTAELSLEYYCPVSKLESYSVGDLIPHDPIYNIEAILDGLNNGELEYIQALESATGISSSSVGQNWQNVQNWQNAAGQLGTSDETESGVLALVPFFAAFPLFGAFLLVLVAFGVLYLLIKKAVS